jgi:heme/copper-type cytochrome/quinol oxidase subunit 2
MLTNTVTLWVIFAALLVVWTIYFAYVQISNRFRKQPEKPKQAATSAYKSVKGNVRHQLFVGIPVRLLLLLYLVFAVTSMHNLIDLGKDFSSVVAIVTLVALAACFAFVTNKYFSSLYHDAKHKKEQFGWLARIIHLERNKSRALVYPILFLARRLIASFIFVYLYKFYAA